MNAVNVHGGGELLERISRNVGRLTDDVELIVLGIATLRGLALRLSSEI